MTIVVTNLKLFNQLQLELSESNILISSISQPIKQVRFKDPKTLKEFNMLLLETWDESFLRGREVHKIYTGPLFYHGNRAALELCAATNVLAYGIKNFQIILQVA